MCKRSSRRRAVAAGVLAAAVVVASAASLGGLSARRIGAQDTVVVAPFADGAELSWGEPRLTPSGWVVDEVVLSRGSVGADDVLSMPFSSLTADEEGHWWSSPQLNLNGGTTTVDPGAGGLVLDEPPMVGSDRTKAGALYYTGLQPLSSVRNAISVEFEPLGPGTDLIDVLVQLPVYVGSGPVDIYQTLPLGSPIFAAGDNDHEGVFLNPVAGPTGATSTTVDPETTEFNIAPPQPYLLNLAMPFADPSHPDHDPAVYGAAPAVGANPAGTARTWRGTFDQFLANFPSARTPGLFISLGSNGSTTSSKSLTVTSVTYGSSWSFAPAPALPAGNVEVAVSDAAGALLAEGSAVASGASNSVVVPLSAPLPVSELRRVSVVVSE